MSPVSGGSPPRLRLLIDRLVLHGADLNPAARTQLLEAFTGELEEVAPAHIDTASAATRSLRQVTAGPAGPSPADDAAALGRSAARAVAAALGAVVR